MAILDATQMNAGNIYGGRASIEDKVRDIDGSNSYSEY